MKQFNYNNTDYFFDDNITLVDLLNREDLIVLPLSIWKDILKLKKGIVNTYDLYYVLDQKIRHYDKSKNVNSFNFKEKSYWLDKNTRLGLMNLANCSESSVQVFLEPVFIEIDSNKLKEFLKQLEIYSAKCYINTQKHLLEIKKLRTVEDLINYNYIDGYPEKIILNE